MKIAELWLDLVAVIQSRVRYVRMRKTNIIYKCIHVESRKILQMNLLKSRNKDTDRYMDTKVGKGEWDQSENWDPHILCIK